MSTKVKEPKPAKLILESKANRRTMDREQCHECKRWRSPAWKYFKSNYGPVHLCIRCEAKVLDRSFGKIDVLDRAKHNGHFYARGFRQ